MSSLVDRQGDMLFLVDRHREFVAFSGQTGGICCF